MIFCQNKLCRAHVHILDEYRPGERVNFVDAAGVSTSLRRFEIIQQEPEKRFDFCEVCANVLAIVHGKTE